MNNATEFVTVYIGQQLSAEEIEQLYEDEQKLVNLPRLRFTQIDTYYWRISFHEDHGALGGIENAKNALRIAVHRKYPDCKVE